MENLSQILRIIDVLINGPKSMEFISKACKINMDNLKEIFRTIYKYGMDNYVKIKVYNNLEEVFDIEEYMKEFENLEVELWGDEIEIDKINDLTEDERWAIYDLISYCPGNLIEGVREKILKCYEEEFYDKYSKIDNRRIIKQCFDIFNISKDIIINLYYHIENKESINLMLINGKIIYDVFPIRIFYNEDLVGWYLEYGKKKKSHIIRLDKLYSMNRSKYPYKEIKADKYYWGFGRKAEIIKLRIFNEKNAKELCTKILVRKEIINKEYCDNFVDVTVKVCDINLIKRWVRSMTPQVIILEPEKIKQEMIKEIKEIYLR